MNTYASRDLKCENFFPLGLRAVKTSGREADRLDLNLRRDENSSDVNGQRASTAEPILINDRPIDSAIGASEYARK